MVADHGGWVTNEEVSQYYKWYHIAHKAVFPKVFSDAKPVKMRCVSE
jgi:hypothetical protein